MSTVGAWILGFVLTVSEIRFEDVQWISQDGYERKVIGILYSSWGINDYEILLILLKPPTSRV